MEPEETNHSTRGLPRVAGSVPATKLRVMRLLLTAVLGSGLVIWVTSTTWERIDRLQREFSSLHADSFYVGVRLRGDIQRLNDTLLRYRLRGDPADYDEFHTGIDELKQWLATSRTNAVEPVERNFFSRIDQAYENYRTESIKVLEANRARWASSQAREFQDSYEKVQKQSLDLLDVCNAFIDDQRSAFDDFLKESNSTLSTFKQLLRLSLALLTLLAAALVVLVYRGMIAPLRYRLTESRAIIARQEKLASLGVLAAGVAHEIRNPLTAIKFRLFSLKKTLPARGADNEDALVISNEISRLERIVKDFLQFARPSEPDFVDLPLHRILLEVRDLLKPQLSKSGIALKVEPSDEVWVSADMQQIKQVLINLIQNSADSIGRNGEITLRIRDGLNSNRKPDGEPAVVDVVDTGKGIPPEVQQRLFDPFFTTKDSGTGLGLPIAARIVEKHGGELRYETHLNRGTTFSIVLPRLRNHETESIVDRR